MTRTRRPTLLDRMLDNIDQKILWLQQERAELLQWAEKDRRTARAPKPTRLAITRDAGAVKD